MKVYLSGKITGDSNYKAKFNKISDELVSYGYKVFNPAVLPDGFDYEDYMEVDLLMLTKCDAIFLLRDWKVSPGAMREYQKALSLGLKVMTEDDIKIRRTLRQLSSDSLMVSRMESFTEEEAVWAGKLENLSLEVKRKIEKFNLLLSEEKNLLLLFETFDDEKKKFFLSDFIKDAEKQLEYDFLEMFQGNDFEEKIKVTQMFRTSKELLDIIESRCTDDLTA